MKTSGRLALTVLVLVGVLTFCDTLAYAQSSQQWHKQLSTASFESIRQLFLNQAVVIDVSDSGNEFLRGQGLTWRLVEKSDITNSPYLEGYRIIGFLSTKYSGTTARVV